MRKTILLLLLLTCLFGAMWLVWGRLKLDKREAPDTGERLTEERLSYANDQYGFSLMLPAAWEGYRAFTSADEENEGAIVLLSLPVERYAAELEAPQDLANGVLVVGIEVFARAYVEEQRALCSEEQELIDRYQVTMNQGQAFEGTDDDQEFIDECLSLRDPQSQNEAVRAAYLGENEQYYFFRVPFAQFDNGFRDTPSALNTEIEGVYQSWKLR